MAKPKPSSELTITLSGPAAAHADKVTLKRSTANTSYTGNARARTTQTESMSLVRNADGTTSTRIRKTESMTITNGAVEPPKGGRRTAATPGSTSRIVASASSRGGGAAAAGAIDFGRPVAASGVVKTARSAGYGGISKS